LQQFTEKNVSLLLKIAGEWIIFITNPTSDEKVCSSLKALLLVFGFDRAVPGQRATFWHLIVQHMPKLQQKNRVIILLILVAHLYDINNVYASYQSINSIKM